jgi:hypothetical protein
MQSSYRQPPCQLQCSRYNWGQEMATFSAVCNGILTLRYLPRFFKDVIKRQNMNWIWKRTQIQCPSYPQGILIIFLPTGCTRCLVDPAGVRAAVITNGNMCTMKSFLQQSRQFAISKRNQCDLSPRTEISFQ